MSADDDKLSRLLGALGDRPGPDVDLVPAVLSRIRSDGATERARRSRKRWWALTVAIPAVALAGCMSIPAVRTAVLDLFHLHGIVVREGTLHASTSPSPSGIVGQLRGPGQLGRRTTLDAAETASAGRLLVPTALGPPTDVWQDGSVVDLIYGGDATHRPTWVITEVTETSQPLLEKIITPETKVTKVDIGADHGLWISGLQELAYLDGRGHGHVIDNQLGGDSLLWEHADVTIRLETAQSEAAAVAVARSMH